MEVEDAEKKIATDDNTIILDYHDYSDHDGHDDDDDANH